MSTSPDRPLRIGVLGAARICAEAIIAPAHAGGHRLVAVAARDRARAEEFAAANGFEKVHENYQAVIDDPDVDVIYNPLPNSLHAEWNIAAVRAGKHVLTEKPSAQTAAEAREVQTAVEQSGVTFLEGFHYFHHPVTQRLHTLLGSGELGELRRVEVDMFMPAPAEGDPRWSPELAGGSLMDLGCYGVHASRHFGRWAGGDPTAVAARSGENPAHPGVDEWFEADLTFPSGATGALRNRMLGSSWRMTIDVTGTRGAAHVASYVKANLDDRVVIDIGGIRTTENLGTRPSYSYQLDVLAARIHEGTPLPWGEDDPVRNMELIDSCRTLATATNVAARN